MDAKISDCAKTFAEVIKIIDTDYETFAVIYTCAQIQDGGACAPGRHAVHVMSRDVSSMLSISTEQLVFDAVRAACFEPGDLRETPHSRKL